MQMNKSLRRKSTRDLKITSCQSAKRMSKVFDDFRESRKKNEAGILKRVLKGIPFSVKWERVTKT
jgi:hypothetical protein